MTSAARAWNARCNTKSSVARPPIENRRNVADATLTLRLTRQDRELLQELVALKAAELVDSGMEATAASYVRGLIRHEARAKGLLTAGRQKKRDAAADALDEKVEAAANGSRGYEGQRSARRR
jgi:hypothetical protein